MVRRARSISGQTAAWRSLYSASRSGRTWRVKHTRGTGGPLGDRSSGGLGGPALDGVVLQRTVCDEGAPAAGGGAAGLQEERFARGELRADARVLVQPDEPRVDPRCVVGAGEREGEAGARVVPHQPGADRAVHGPLP